MFAKRKNILNFKVVDVKRNNESVWKILAINLIRALLFLCFNNLIYDCNEISYMYRISWYYHCHTFVKLLLMIFYQFLFDCCCCCHFIDVYFQLFIHYFFIIFSLFYFFFFISLWITHKWKHLCYH